MADLLSALRKPGDHRDPDEFNPVLCVDWYNEALDDVREALLAELDRLQRMDNASVIPLTFIDALMAIRRWAGGDDE